MTRPPPEDERDPALPKQLPGALAELDLLLPETPAEVQRAELAHPEHAVQLPAGLQHFRPRTAQAEPPSAAHPEPPSAGQPQDATVLQPASNVLPLQKHRAAHSTGKRAEPNADQRGRRLRSSLVGGLGFALGAAAASVLWLPQVSQGQDPELPLGGASSELREQPPQPATPLQLSVAGCTQCCAGSACGSAKEELSSCPSGRTCVNCSPGDSPSAYRLRISALALSEVGKNWAQKEAVQLDTLQLCASIQGRSLGCRSAVEAPADLLDWAPLPVATVAAQLVGGLSITLQAPDARALATWSSSVTVSPEILCRGVAARLVPSGGEALGRVSVFFDDAQYVELARAATVAELVSQQRLILLEGASLSIYETNAPAAQRFALVFGPTDRARAEALRWQLLDQKREGTITFGDDHKGRPRPR